MYPIADLHCDLLSYLAYDEKRTVRDEVVRCSLPQFKKGNVLFQTLAVYTETGKKSVAFAEKQFTLFRTLPKIYPDAFERINHLKFPAKQSQKVHIAVSIENASGLCSEAEPLEACFTRFEQYQKMAGPIIYMSLTWNHENRFGGGNLSRVGLKEDGARLLDYLSGKGIAIDLSHTSDALAHEILDYIDKKSLQLMPLASHSNFRAICEQSRNLSDEIACEIIKRGGVIGLNFFKAFVGRNCPEDFIRHVDYARSLGAFDNHCFGADFFYDKELPLSLYPFPFFYERFGDAGCYPDVLTYLNEVFTKQELKKIAYKNLGSFFERLSATGTKE